ncbi:cbb3-type cytochrome oxidase subunit 3 [Pseudidiomarina salilacus]|uniref:cbb3-type cytochrome oxidase subunit 3 n=1 Tax=Pseudidiomarina salilacus TaxID=3384452 RepID=UPI00398560FA
MDYITWRSIYTVLVFVVFVAIIWWAYSKSSKKRFDEAANSIFEEDELEQKANDTTKQESKNNE